MTIFENCDIIADIQGEFFTMPVTLTATYSPRQHTPSGELPRTGVSPVGTVITAGTGLGGVNDIRRNDFYNTFDTDDQYPDASASNLIDPIVGFYYEEDSAYSAINLLIKGDVGDSGWTVLFNHHNNFVLRRADASRFYIPGDDITKFTWVRADFLGNTYSEELELRSFFERDYLTLVTPSTLSMSFANEDIITPEIKTIERTLGYTGTETNRTFSSNFEMTNLQPKFEGESTGFRWDLNTTRIYAKTFPGSPAFLNTRPHPDLPDIGPIVKNVIGCRVYWPIDLPSNINDSNQFNCLGYIHGETPPNTSGYDAWKAKIVGKKVRSFDGSFRATVTDASFAISTIQKLALDFDVDGNVDALTDGLMMLRYFFSLEGDALIEGAVAVNALRTSADEIEAYLANPIVQEILDFDQNGTVDALTDGLLLLRFAFSLEGDALVGGAVANDSPLSDAEVEAAIEAAMTRMITLNNDLTVYEGVSASGDSSAGTTLTYTVDSDSLRQRPASYSANTRGHALFLEQHDRTTPHSIRNQDGTYTGNSSFRFTWLSPTFGENANKIIGADTDFNNEPMGIIEPKDTNTGSYSADLLPSVENRQSDFVNNRTRFVLQGRSGPTQEVVHSNTTGSEAPTSTLDLSPYGQLVSWKINRHTDEVPSGSGYTIESQENCTVTVRQDNLKAIGGSLFLSVEPGFGGERYAAKVKIRYPSGNYYHRLEGNIRGPHRSDVVGFVYPTANTGSLSEVNYADVINYSPALEGRDGLRLQITLQTNIDENEQEDYLGQLVSVTPTLQRGGSLVTLAGPLKKNPNDTTNIDFIQDSTYFIPDGSDDEWLFQGYLTVVFANLSRVFNFTANGTWKKDFGMEVLNPNRGTRLNTNTSPLRYVARGNGNAPRTAVQENQQQTSTQQYVPSGSTKTGWFHYITTVQTGRFTTRTDNSIEVWFQGTLILTHTFTGDPSTSPLSKVDFATGNKYDRGSYQEGFNNNVFYKVTETTSTTQEFYVYGDDPVDLNADTSPDADFLVFNNQRESQVGLIKEQGAYDISPSNWLKHDGTRQNGEQDFYLGHNYSFQIVKIN